MSWWDDPVPPAGTPGIPIDWDGRPLRGREVGEGTLRPTGLLDPDGHPILRKPAFGFGAVDQYVIFKG